MIETLLLIAVFCGLVMGLIIGGATALRKDRKEWVVHCDECKFFHVENTGEMWCGRTDGIAPTYNGFCSYGERKDGKGDCE